MAPLVGLVLALATLPFLAPHVQSGVVTAAKEVAPDAVATASVISGRPLHHI